MMRCQELFYYLKLHKHIAVHQIRQIMVFLAMSYDPFNTQLKLK